MRICKREALAQERCRRRHAQSCVLSHVDLYLFLPWLSSITLYNQYNHVNAYLYQKLFGAVALKIL
jgi:hypothetical protein